MALKVYDYGREKGGWYKRQGAVYAMEQALNQSMAGAKHKDRKFKPPAPDAQGPGQAARKQQAAQGVDDETFLAQNMVVDPSNSFDAWRKKTYG